MKEKKRRLSAEDMRLLSLAEQVFNASASAMQSVSVKEMELIILYIDQQVRKAGESFQDQPSDPPRQTLVPLLRMAAAWAAYSIIRNMDRNQKEEETPNEY
jgi:hypothetical protein